MLKKSRFLLFVPPFLLMSASICLGEEPVVYDRIIVTSRKGVWPYESHYPTQTVAVSGDHQENFDSLSDFLEEAAGLDLRYRGRYGIQGDISLRGATFNQVGVLIDGVPVTDPQTGHHNLDIPLTSFDVESVEVTKEGTGSVNFKVKKPVKKVLNIDTLVGEHALFGNAFSFSLPSEKLSSRVSFEHKISKGARPNTDFEYETGSVYLLRPFEGMTWDGLLGYLKKDFGADSFYSNLFSEEEEHTSTFLFRTGLEGAITLGLLKSNLYLRKHRDKFILERNNPVSVNYHTTYVYGQNSELRVSFPRFDLLLGEEIGTDQINSTNLGKHTRQHGSLSFGLASLPIERLSAGLNLRLQEYQDWGFRESYDLALGYFIIDKRLKLNASAGHAARIPTFTELFYSDAANKGNPNLDAEESDNFRCGLGFEDSLASCSLEGFLRRGRHLIDWTRVSATDPWQAANLGRVDFRGLEFIFGLKPEFHLRGLELKGVRFSYTYMDTDKKETGFLSKYALDILRHQLSLGFDSKIAGLNFNWRLSYNQRCFGETYFLGDLTISKRIETGGCTFGPFLKIDNFSDSQYSEVGGVRQPGRWVQGGMKLEW